MKAVKFLSMATMAFVLWTSLASCDDGCSYTTITVSTAGSLPALIKQHQDKITCLRLKGELNGTDIRYIREISGDTGYLENLDLSEARIVAGGYYWKAEDGTHYDTTDNEISEYMFLGCTSLSCVAIPNSATSIGGYAFSDCRDLKSVTIPNSVTSIGDDAFYGCKSLTSVIIPNSVTYIGDDAFYDCKSLTSVIIPNSVTYIGDGAFGNCSDLKSVTIPKLVTSIGDWAFDSCSNLKSITIGNSVTSIGENAFGECSGLKSVYITDLEKWCNMSFSSFETSPLSYAHNLYVNGKLATSITIPSSVTSIKDYAFSGCRVLKSVTIPKSVTSIGDWAFYSCRDLKSVTIPNSVTSIGDGAFWYCSDLTNIYALGTTPAKCDNDIFEGVNSSTCTLHVPAGCTTIYEKEWGYFSSIVDDL